MKYIIIAVIVIGAVLGVTFYGGKTVVYENSAPQVVEKEKIVEVDQLNGQIEQRSKELEEKYNAMRLLEAEEDVLVQDIADKQQRLAEVRKQLAGFMTATTSGR